MKLGIMRDYLLLIYLKTEQEKRFKYRESSVPLRFGQRFETIILQKPLVQYILSTLSIALELASNTAFL